MSLWSLFALLMIIVVIPLDQKSLAQRSATPNPSATTLVSGKLTALRTWILIKRDTELGDEWRSQLPPELRAKTAFDADLIVTIVKSTVKMGTQRYTTCGEVNGYMVVYDVSIRNKKRETVAKFSLDGSRPTFPLTIPSPRCPGPVGEPPTFRDFFSIFKKYAYIQVSIPSITATP